MCRHSVICIFLILLPAYFITTGAWAAGNLTQNSSRECAICHFRWIDQFVEGHGTALAEYETEDVAGDEMMCFSCHDGSTEDSRSKVWLLDMHKTGVVPSDKVKIPKLFPLSHEGKMMCATCHSAHSNPTDTSIERSIFLRITNNDSIMCEMCHVNQLARIENHPIHEGKEPLPDRIFAEGATPSFTDPRHVICESCHTPHGGVERNLVYTLVDSGLCAICHGDKIDAEGAPPAEQVNHSLFVKFKADPTLRIELKQGEGGTLQCLSCHKVHQHAPGSKALVAGKKTLCGYCHADKDMKQTAAPKTANHPLDVTFKPVVAGEFVPEGGENNTVQCFSCHAVHRHKPGTKGLPAAREVLCATCHADQVLVEGTDHDLRVTSPEDINVLEQSVRQFGVCVSCHVPHKATGPYLWARGGKEGGELTPSGLCLVCHGEQGPAAKKGVGSHTHPVGVQVKDAAQLPLNTLPDSSTVMECHTCHDPHRWQPGLRISGQGVNVEGDGSSSFLRQPIGTSVALCSSCHAEQYRVDATDHDLRITAQEESNIAGQGVEQAGVCSPCHIPHNGTGPRLWARSLEEERKTSSRLCLSCHNSGGPGKAKLVGKYSHLVGVPVPGSPELPLFKEKDVDGLMECATCHNPHNWIPGGEHKGEGKNVEGNGASSFLRIANQSEPRLCTECHERQGYVVGTDHDLRITAPESQNLRGEKPAGGTVCAPCHSVHNAVSQPALWITDLSSGARDFMARTCYGCHRRGGIGAEKLVSVGSHPERFYFGYNKPYSIAQHYIPDAVHEYPLFDGNGNKTPAGEITCPTCHDPHVWHPDRLEQGPGRNVEGTPVDSFLRKDVRRGLCYACHGIKTLFLYRYYHVEEERKMMVGPYSPSMRR
jgi:predicted CXXCH cytochrome family protein